MLRSSEQTLRSRVEALGLEALEQYPDCISFTFSRAFIMRHQVPITKRMRAIRSYKQRAEDCGSEEIMSKAYGVPIVAAVLTVAVSGSSVALTQNKLSTVDGVQVVCTGVGSSKSNSRWTSMPVKLVFANRRGQFTAGENVVVRQGRRFILQTSCDAPWLLLRPATLHD